MVEFAPDRSAWWVPWRRNKAETTTYLWNRTKRPRRTLPDFFLRL